MDYTKELFENTKFDKNESLNDMIYEAIKEFIIRNKIPIGTRIIEKEYADMLNISRTPVRYALKKLEKDNLIEYKKGIGAIVKKIDKNDVIEIYKIRKALEMLAVENALQNITKKEIQDIRQLVNRAKSENEKGNSEKVFEMFCEFNNMIYKTSHMPKLADMIKDINQYLIKFRRISISDYNRRVEVIEEHLEIIDDIENKNMDVLKQVISKHLQSSLNIILKYMN